jgi:hypothetical protein
MHCARTTPRVLNYRAAGLVDAAAAITDWGRALKLQPFSHVVDVAVRCGGDFVGSKPVAVSG